MRDTLRQYTQARQALEAERDQIRERIQHIIAALCGTTPVNAGPGPVAPRRGRPPREGLGMRDAINAATRGGPLGVRDLVDAVKKVGFRFTSKNPYNSIGAYLYGKEGKKYFKKVDGGFVAK